MGLFLSLIAKDLRRRLAAPSGVLISLAIPLAIVGAMALAFGGGGGTGHPRIRIVVADLDKSPLSNMIDGVSGNPEAAEHLDIRMVGSREEGLAVMRDEDYAALLVIPEGFAEAVLDGRQTELELIKNPAQSLMPIVAEEGAQVLALYLSVGARFLDADDIERLRKLFEGEGWDDAVGLAASITDIYIRITRAEEILFPPLIDVETHQLAEGEEEEEGAGVSLFTWMYPGMLVMGLLFVGLTQMKDLLQEREAGTLCRQLAAPVGPGRLLLAKVASVALVVAAALVLLLASGSFLFQIRWGSPAALAAVGAGLVFAVTGFSALIFAVVKTERQGDAFGGVVVMLMSLVGGAFIPPQVLPEFLRGVSLFTLNHWANESLRALSMGGGWERIGQHLGPLIAIGFILTAAGVAFLRMRHMRGVL
jgi:ABC-type multidrug transport system permease subunit